MTTESGKKFKIITTIEDDAPFGHVNYYTISFLTPQKMDNLKYIEVKGFKVHNGYTNFEMADEDCKKIKSVDPNHDVFIAQIGKLSAWDDATKTDDIEYDNEKLNSLEKTRRENADKLKLMKEQLGNESKNINSNVNADRLKAQRERLHKRLYEKGLISQKEYELMQEENRPTKEIRELARTLENLKQEFDQCYRTDYLVANEPVGLKFGCISIYSPKRIGGLTTLCFKVRGMFQTMPELNRRVRKLKSLYPNDLIYAFELGKWTAFSETMTVEPLDALKQLNYSMKFYLENLEKEKEDFEKRKESLQTQTDAESKLKRANIRREKRKAKKDGKKKGTNTIEPTEPSEPTEPLEPHEISAEKVNAESAPKSGVQLESEIESPQTIPSFGNIEDDAEIQKILEYIDDPVLRKRFASDSASMERVEVTV